MADILAEKKNLRKVALANRRALSIEERDTASRELIHKLMATDFYAKAKNIMLYASMKDEVQLAELIGAALAQKKTVLLPKVTGEHSMEAVELENLAELTADAFGILAVQGKDFFPAAEIDLVVVPGVAFTASGERLGMGRGYYDRFLTEQAKNAYRVALAFETQFFPELPTDDNDARLDALITEKREFYFKR